jgi:hypothetical protein
VFNASDLNHVGNCAYWTVDQPGSPVSLAFNSKNQMVVGNDGYYGDASQRQLKQLWFYSNPLSKQTPDASIDLYMGTPGDIAFDANDNFLIQDHTWYKVWTINLGCDPEWLSYLPGAITPTLPTCPSSLPARLYLPLVARNYIPPTKPVFVYPVNGQTLDYPGAYLFKVEPIAAAQGFLWSFFQNGVMVWENLRDEGILSGNEYGIHPGTEAHGRFVPGSVEVWVSAMVDTQWTDTAVITIHLQ